MRKSFLILMKAVSIMIKLQIDIKAERERTLSKTWIKMEEEKEDK